MKILFVALSDSIHTARCINQLSNTGWDIRLFPSIDRTEIHPELKKLTIYQSFYGKKNTSKNNVTVRGIPVLSQDFAKLGIKVLKKMIPGYRIFQLKKVIQSFKPDIIHSLEMQNAGYLIANVKKNYSGQFPPWIVTNWGSDIYLFGELKEHIPKIKELLSLCDYYSCECIRDVSLAKKFGFKGKFLPILPNTGGFDIEKHLKYKQSIPPSQRRIIMLKGYQGWSGRALFAIAALNSCAKLLKRYTIVIYSSHPDSGVSIAAELFTKNTGINTVILPKDTPHETMLKLHGKARISISVSISDGISTSLLEAMVMGSFPIQSCTSCADEWILDGKTGILVPPENPEKIAQAISRALTNNKLVDNAAKQNREIARKRLVKNQLQETVIQMYKKIVNNSL